ncbi:MAG TPA: hypothetical protein VM537_14570 [Anaerolineae bacterium]|nr:hypothetical protein [Anaerolineae bacterium]
MESPGAALVALRWKKTTKAQRRQVALDLNKARRRKKALGKVQAKRQSRVAAQVAEEQGS